MGHRRRPFHLGFRLIVGAVGIAMTLAVSAHAVPQVAVPDNNPVSSPIYKVKPKTLRLPSVVADAGATVRNIKWRNWGKTTATGRGNIRIGDPDNGYITSRGSIRLSKIVSTNCGDLRPRPIYTRATLIGVKRALGRNTFTFSQLLVC